jgi:hypothetical protein
MAKTTIFGAIFGLMGVAVVVFPGFGRSGIGRAVPDSVARNIHGGCPWNCIETCNAPGKDNSCASGTTMGSGQGAWDSGNGDCDQSQQCNVHSGNTLFCGGGIFDPNACDTYYTGGLYGCSS